MAQVPGSLVSVLSYLTFERTGHCKSTDNLRLISDIFFLNLLEAKSLLFRLRMCMQMSTCKHLFTKIYLKPNANTGRDMLAAKRMFI